VGDDLPKCRRQGSGCGWCVGTGVGDAEAAPEVQFGQLNAGLSCEIGLQPERTPCRDLERLSVEDLRADVRVDTDEIEPGMTMACE
jgi:hypothetical protein